MGHQHTEIVEPGARYDQGAMLIAFSGGMAILVAFAVTTCVVCYVCRKRFDSIDNKRRRFVDKYLPTKKYATNEAQSLSQHQNNKQPSRLAHKESKDSLPTHKKDRVNVDVCTICLLTPKEGDEISWSKNGCLHTFHTICIAEWLYKSTECPMCRKTFLQQDEANQDLPNTTTNETGANDVETGSLTIVVPPIPISNTEPTMLRRSVHA